jgi:hypothetical protein
MPVEPVIAIGRCLAREKHAMPLADDAPRFADMRASILAVAALLLLAAAPAGPTLSAEEAAGHVGETATVCGTVASARFAQRSKAQPTFLNLEKPYPDQLFTIVIFGRDREKFGTPESALLHQRVCATGLIKLYDRRPEMTVEDPARLGKAAR